MQLMLQQKQLKKRVEATEKRAAKKIVLASRKRIEKKNNAAKKIQKVVDKALYDPKHKMAQSVMKKHFESAKKK